MVRKINTNESNPIVGMTWFENKIYTIHRWSTIVHTFQDHEPFSEETPIEIKDMDDPSDMTASKLDRAIFICDSDDDNRCLWRIQMPYRKIRRYKIDGRPWSLSITPSGDLLVTAERRDRYYLNIYGSSDVKQLQSILVPTEIMKLYPAVQTTNGTFVIACYDSKFPGMHMISELSKDGRQLLQTFDLQSIDSIPLNTWEPRRLAIGEYGNIFIADTSADSHRVILFNSRLNRIQMELNHDRHQIDRPTCLCYVREKKMLIIGQLSPFTGAGSICVFDNWNNY